MMLQHMYSTERGRRQVFAFSCAKEKDKQVCFVAFLPKNAILFHISHVLFCILYYTAAMLH